MFKVNAGQLRKKSDYFASVMRDYWHESTEILLPHIEPCGWEIYKDWLYDREPRWFKHYSSVELGPRDGPAAESDAADEWPAVSGVKLDTRRSRYCHHLCRLMVYGSCLGENFQSRILRRLRKITLDSPAGKTTVTAEEQEADKLDWTTTFVLAPSTLRLIYDSTDDDMIDGEVSPLRSWAVDVTASRLDMRQLRRFLTKDLPNGYVSEVYQKKFLLETQAHCRELDKLREEHQELRVELASRDINEQRMSRELNRAEVRVEECLRAGCTPKSPRCCKLYEYHVAPVPRDRDFGRGQQFLTFP